MGIMTQKESQPQVIYLDQKCWIELAKIYFGNPKEQDRLLLTKMQNAVVEQRAIFPLTLSNMEETYRISNNERRKKLAHLMISLSKGYSFQPYVERNLTAEIVNIVLRKIGAPTIDIRSTVLKQGISNMVGAKGALEQKEGAIPLPDEVMADLLKRTESAEALEILLSLGSPSDLATTRTSDIEMMERIRHELWKVKDNNLRHRVFLAQNVFQFVLPELAKISVEYNLPRDFIIKEGITRKEIDTFIDSIPTALCLFTLIYHRDQQRTRPIQANDFNDIWFLTLAIPYSDIVVTERMWTSISIRSKLDKKCHTKIFSSINDLAQFL